jgi:hypothetical protein
VEKIYDIDVDIDVDKLSSVDKFQPIIDEMRSIKPDYDNRIP